MTTWIKPNIPQELRVAVVHDWVAARRGAEKVFERIAGLFPRADLWALTVAPDVELEVSGREVRTTWLDRRIVREHRAVTLPLMPLAWRTVPKSRYDIVISSSGAFAHTATFGGQPLRLAYVYSPARYVWIPDLDGRGGGKALAPITEALRSYDRRAARSVDSYCAISTDVRDRIRRFWQRDARIIHPPVDTEFYTPGPPGFRSERDYVLGVSRWVGYKRLDLVIESARVAGLRCVIAGNGPEGYRLRQLAERQRVSVEFVESPSDEALRSLYRNAAALVFPAYEDFGIVPVEAQACGTPVVALGEGGSLDTVVPGVSGVLVREASPEAFGLAIEEARSLDPDGVRLAAERFCIDRFDQEFCAWVEERVTASVHSNRTAGAISETSSRKRSGT